MRVSSHIRTEVFCRKQSLQHAGNAGTRVKGAVLGWRKPPKAWMEPEVRFLSLSYSTLVRKITGADLDLGVKADE